VSGSLVYSYVTFRKIDKKPAEIIIEESEKRKEPVSRC
jgi:hypothetical protein